MSGCGLARPIGGKRGEDLTPVASENPSNAWWYEIDHTEMKPPQPETYMYRVHGEITLKRCAPGTVLGVWVLGI